MTDAIQLPLFRRLPIPRGAKPCRRRSRRYKHAGVADLAPCWIGKQSAFEFILRTLGDEPDDDYDFPTRRVVRASDCAPLPTRAPASIWALASAAQAEPRADQDDAPAYEQPRTVELMRSAADGVTRHVGACYPSNRWTQERDEQEEARRARQRPPRPTSKAKTRGKKVREWDGEAVDDR